jgi:hydroxypyruvate reductase
MAGAPDVWALACDTDGIDGSESNAGAILSPDALKRSAAKGMSADALAADNDAWTFFNALDDLVTTGPTLTNVNDYRVILVL